jgi:uncharacterized alpha/beta hydrolase family protein
MNITSEIESNNSNLKKKKIYKKKKQQIKKILIFIFLILISFLIILNLKNKNKKNFKMSNKIKKTATVIFSHGLGDSSTGWSFLSNQLGSHLPWVNW